jgi:hypothetical protein
MKSSEIPHDQGISMAVRKVVEEYEAKHQKGRGRRREERGRRWISGRGGVERV